MLRRVARWSSVESTVAEKIKTGLGGNTQVEVVDLSGGCGTMLQIKVSSDSFKGKTVIQQHRLVNRCIGDQDLHGFKLETQELKS